MIGDKDIVFQGRLLTRLLVLCLFLRALIPAGFMPDLAAARDGVITITICTAYGMTTVALDENGDPVEPDQAPETETREHCRFAPAGPVDLPPVTRTPTPVAFALPASPRTLQDDVRVTRQTAGAVGPRAPPTSS